MIIGSEWNNFLQIHNVKQSIFICEDDTEIQVGDFVSYSGSKIIVNKGAFLRLGFKSYINRNSIIECSKYISIGDNVMIGEDVKIFDCNHHTIHRENFDLSKPIVIENNVWIGSNSIILPGVIIGEGAIVAAGSVVAHDVPPKTLVAGNPAIVKRKDVRWG